MSGSFQAKCLLSMSKSVLPDDPRSRLDAWLAANNGDIAPLFEYAASRLENVSTGEHLLRLKFSSGELREYGDDRMRVGRDTLAGLVRVTPRSFSRARDRWCRGDV